MISQETLGMDMLLNNAARQGLTLDSNNAGDGNCMFYALQQQLEKTWHQEESQTDQRRTCKIFI